jgi:hypothetical protein
VATQDGDASVGVDGASGIVGSPAVAFSRSMLMAELTSARYSVVANPAASFREHL